MTGVIGILVRGPGVLVATGMPGAAAKATDIKVVITHRFYGGEGVAVGAGVATSVGIYAALSVREQVGKIISWTDLSTEPIK